MPRLGAPGTAEDGFVALLSAEVSDNPAYTANPADMARLALVADDAKRRAMWDQYSTVLWLQAILLENAGQRGAAITLLRAVRDDRDVARGGTRDLWGRAAVTGMFPALGSRLTRLLFDTGADPAERLDTIEWAKGRALKDRAGAADTDPMALTRALCASGRTHYLSLLQAHDATYGVLLTADGALLAGRTGLAEADLARLVQSIAPALRGAHTGDIFEPEITPDWTQVAGGVLRWVVTDKARGPIHRGDHVVLCPHGALHAFPLHELPFADGRPGFPEISMSRVHSASQVLDLARAPTLRPQRFLAVFAPSTDDLPQVHTHFDKVVETLARALPGTVLDDESADFARVGEMLLPGTLLHLWAHGHVPLHRDFWTRSGIALPHDRARLARGLEPTDDTHLISPRRLYDAKWGERLRDGHVTLQACVSGHAAANPQGDAVGLEWAFLLAGARSILSTHWHIGYVEAARFCTAFYEAWLGRQQLTRGQAWRIAAATLLDNPVTRAAWPAFSLTGDWR